MDADCLAENAPNTPKFIQLICPIGQLFGILLKKGFTRFLSLCFLDEIDESIKKQWTIHSATTIPEKCRKVVLQTQIFFSGQPLSSNQKKIWDCTTPFIQPEKRFPKPDFKKLQKSRAQNKRVIEFSERTDRHSLISSVSISAIFNLMQFKILSHFPPLFEPRFKSYDPYNMAN